MPPKALQAVLAKVAGRPDAGFLSALVLRTLQRAFYSPECRGHYALASRWYTHFTSPIRRYPDLFVHRQLKALLRAGGEAAAAGGQTTAALRDGVRNGIRDNAPADGAIDYAGGLKGWGVVVIERLGGAYHLVLAGLETAGVRPGQMVKAGDLVGRMAPANPGDLYFEIRKNGAPVDPASWLKDARAHAP